MSLGKRRVRSPYKNKRYWYHVSTTLKNKHERLIPWDQNKGFNRTESEPEGKRICVAPTIEQCLTAIPYCLNTICSIYRTKTPVKASKPKDVFDVKITNEGWIEIPTSFVKFGILRFEEIEKNLNIDNVIEEAASKAEPRLSGKVLKWWKRARINRFIKKA